MENKKTISILRTALAVTILLAFIQLNVSAQKRTQKVTFRPNIIFIIADDLGYGNVSVYNPTSKVPTPNIDRLAKEGTRYTDFYSGSTVCAPSRASLMTAKSMGHAYIRGNTRLPIRPQDSIFAQTFQKHGYRTGMFGKWGLGEEGTTGSPEIKGFDEFYGYLNQRHAHNYFTDSLIRVKDGKIAKVPHDTNSYSHDDILNNALAFIRQNKGKPFFLYLPFTLPHAELAPLQKDLKEFLNPNGSSKFAPETPYKQGKSTYLSQKFPRAAFATMVTKLDRSVGQISALIRELGLDDDTYIFFTSDNGPHKEGGGDPVYFNSSGPLRGIKRDLYEGGIRVPLLVRAPGKVPAGRVSNEQWAFWDIAPTLTDLAQFPSFKGLDGISFKTSIAGNDKQQQKHDHLYWQFNEGFLQEAVIKGNWKLIRFKKAGEKERFELYDLSKDIGERNDVASANAAKVKELTALIAVSKSAPENPEFDWSAVEK